MAILIVGPGAVGLTLAARFAGAGKTALLLGRDQAQEQAATRGFTFAGLDGQPRRIKKALLSARANGPAETEAAFFCVKSYDVAKAAAGAAAWIGPSTAAVGLQNGLGHERILRRRYGSRRVVVGSCYFAADRPSPDRVTSSWGNKIRLALTPDNAESAARAQRLLSESGWDAALRDDEPGLLWTKLIFNAATNPLGALCAVTNGRLAEDDALKDLLLRVLREGLAAAARLGRKPLYDDMAEIVVKACRAAPRQRNSMLQDLASGRRTEIDAIARPILRAGGAPALAALARWVRQLEAAA